MGEGGWSDGLLEAGFGDAVTAALVGWPARVGRMLEVEAALGRALARVGLIPEEAAEAIGRVCDPARVDTEQLARSAGTAATPVIPLLGMLATGADGSAAAWLHHGATSQDVIDTASTLQVRAALDRLDELLEAVADRCAALADTHRDTVMPGRTVGQQAVPITFGLKAARWLGVLDRRRAQLRSVRTLTLVVQLGGAAGTSAVYGDAGLAVAEALAEELGLAVPDLPWHGERDRIVELAGALAGIAAATASIATDLVLLAQSEVAEAREGSPSSQGSSAMPHKRNPVNATAARAASRLALGDVGVLQGGEHEHERAAGAWQAEWVALPSGLVRTAGALERLRAALADLEVDTSRARENLDSSLGLTAAEALASALTPALGRPQAQELTAALAGAAGAHRRHLRDVAGDDHRVTAVLGPSELAAALDPVAGLRLVSTLIDRALATHDDMPRSPTGAHHLPGIERREGP